jgi:hypothetical protein
MLLPYYKVEMPWFTSMGGAGRDMQKTRAENLTFYDLHNLRRDGHEACRCCLSLSLGSGGRDPVCVRVRACVLHNVR